MFKSYIKLALRNLWKRKTTTAINILSLSVGLAACALVFLFAQHELSFDKGFDNAGDIYRVVSNFKDGGAAPTVALPYAKYLKTEIPEVEQVSRMDPTVGTVIVQAKEGATPFAEDSGYWVDANFFDVLSFNFLQGDRKTAFAAPNTIVLSQSLAQKMFSNTASVGQTLKVDGLVYTITGVFAEDFLNHIKADFFANNNSDRIRDKMLSTTNWVVNPNYYTYIKLRHGSNIQHVTTQLNAYFQRHAAADLKAYNDHVTNSLQALTDIHLHSAAFFDYLAYKQGNIKYLYMLGSIALIILLLGCINYMNLTTAQAIGRAREVGVRRVMGAAKAAIRYQFLIETLLISVCALLVAIGLGFAALPLFNSLTAQSLSFFAPENASLILWLLLITLVTGLAAGLYPAFYLSDFKPVKVLKGTITEVSGIFSVRKVLIVSQFIISTCLIFATIVIWDQLHYMLNAKPGFDQDQQLVLNLNSEQSQKNSGQLMRILSNNVNFKSVTQATAPLISGDMNLYPANKSMNDKELVYFDYTDENYIKTLGLQLLSGINISPEAFTNTNMQEDMEVHDFGHEVILNEEAAKLLGFDPYTAPGKMVSHLHNGVVYNYKIVGVVKNYHYFSLHAAIGPCAIMAVNPLRCNTIVAKVDGRNVQPAVDYASKSWRSLNQDTPFSYAFLDALFQGDYDQDQRQQKMMGMFSGVAIFISCLGLLGLITYTLTQKAKEIGIRKVIGASIGNIVAQFTRQYIKLVIVANLIAWPIAWYLMTNWLKDFPYRVTISWWAFAISLTGGLLICFATIAFKTIKAAMANPMDSLRAE